MKRWIKISAITIGSLLAFIIAAICIVGWLVFTPAKLTAIVNKTAAKYLTCEMQVGEIDLDLFSSFPDVSLRLSNVILINPITEAQTDTVAAIEHCEAVLDLKALTEDTTIVLRRLHLYGGKANLFTAADGTANYMVFPNEASTEEDSLENTFPLPNIDIQEIAIRNLNIAYQDLALGQEAMIQGFDMELNGSMMQEELQAAFNASVQKMSATIEGDTPMSATIENIGMKGDASMQGTDGQAAITLQVEQLDAAMPDMQAHLTQIKWTLHGSKQANLWKALTTLTTQPIEAKLEGDAPMSTSLNTFNMTANGEFDGENINLTPSLSAAAITFNLGKECMLNQANIQLSGNLATDSTLQHLSLTQGKMSLNEYEIGMDGQVDMPDTSIINATLHFATNHWEIPRLLTLVPESYRYLLEGIEISGCTSLQGSINGGIRANEPILDKADIAVNLDHIDLAYNDSIALKSLASKLAVSYTGKSDRATGKLYASNLDVAMTGLADANLEEVQGNFTLRRAMKIIDGHIDAQAHLAMRKLEAAMDTLELYTQKPTVDIAINANGTSLPQFDMTLHLDTMHTAMGNMLAASTSALGIKAHATYNEDGTDLLEQWEPQLAIDMQRGDVNSPLITIPVDIPHIQFDYADGHFTINDSRILLGNSDFGLRGNVHNIDSFISNTGLLKAELDFTSAYTDVTQLMDLVSGLGSTDTTEVEQEPTVTAEDEPFMVPLGVDVRLNTDIRSANVSGFKFDDIGGHVTVKDGVLVLEEMGFTSDAARMQLTAMYKSPRKNHLFLGFDFHLLDIEIDELIHMIPEVDSIIPMLSAFDGEAQFHFAAETYLKSNYELKMSTLRAAGAIEGKDLVVLDQNTYGQIAKLLRFEKDTRNVVDSLNVELTVFRNEVDLYPFLISMDDYQAVIGGRHNIDNDLSFDYHVSLTNPMLLRAGLDITGSLDDMKFKLTECKYKNLYRPEKRNVVQSRTLELKQLIRDSLKDNVKPQEQR